MSETHNIDSHLFEELKSLRQRVSALEGMEAELQRVRQALRHSERQFQLLRDNVADIVRRRMASRPAAPDPEAEAFELEQTEPEIRLRLQGMALLSRINASIGTAEDLDATLHQVCADLARILYLPQASLALFNPERTAAQVIAERHPPHSPPTLGTLLPVAGNPSMTYILEHKGPLMMVNAPMDPSPAAVPGAMPQRRVQSILLVPLLVGNEAIGTLDIGAFERREFSPFEIDLACAVANQVGQVLVRKKAEEALRRERDLAESMQAEIRQHTAQLEALREVGLELAAELNLDDLLYSIVSRAMSLVSGASGGMYLYRPDLDVIEWAISIGPQPDTYGAILHRGEGQSGKVWASGQSLVVDDYSRWEGRAAIYDQYNFKGIVAVPVRWGTQFLGVINVMADSVGAFSPADAELLELFAYQAAIAIRNAQLFRETQRQLAELALLFDTSAALSTSLDVDTVVDTIAHQIAAALDTEQCAISLWDREQETLETRLDYARHPGRQGRPPKTPGSRHFLADYPASRQVLTSRQPLVIQAQDPHADPAELAWMAADGVRSLLMIPLVVGDQAIGLLELMEKHQERIFTPAEIDLGQTLANHAAAALENARLYAETLRHSRELTLLNRVIAASAASLDLESILAVVCRELSLAFGAPHVAAALLDESRTQVFIAGEHIAGTMPSILGETVSLGSTLPNSLLFNQKPAVVTDARRESRLAPFCNRMQGAGVVAVLILPLAIEGEVKGLLGLSFTEPRIWSAEEMGLAGRVAEQVSGVLARARLEGTQRQLSAAVEQSAEAVVVADTTGYLIYVNPSFVRITGLSRAEATARLAEMVHATTPSSAVIQALWDTVHAGQIWQGRLSGQKRLGERYVADTTVTPVRNQAGEIDHFVATMRDVTREVQLEEQFRQAQKMEALGRLAGGIAHDFNNLLTVIHLSTQLLEQKLHPEDPLWELVQRIHETSERAGNLTKQLLSFSRRVVIEPQVLNLNELIDELSRMLQRLIGEDIELVISLSPDLWPVNVDRTQMDQVIVNLSVNARDAMPGGGKLIIETSNVVLDEAFVAAHVGAAPGKHVMLLIGDTGAGMSDEVKAHLFEPFFTTKGEGKGTGLGLPTVYGIVKQNQGYIEVHSEPGKGTTFRIYLPYARAGTAPKRAVTPSTTSGGTETILVVEDKAEVRNLTVQTLQSCGYQVLAAANGREALQVSGEYQGTIHLLLTDVVMPYMGGRELVERLHPQRPETRILYMSGYVDQQLTADVSEQSLAFLAKPFTQEKLTQQVRTVLDIPQP